MRYLILMIALAVLISGCVVQESKTTTITPVDGSLTPVDDSKDVMVKEEVMAKSASCDDANCFIDELDNAVYQKSLDILAENKGVVAVSPNQFTVSEGEMKVIAVAVKSNVDGTSAFSLKVDPAVKYYENQYDSVPDIMTWNINSGSNDVAYYDGNNDLTYGKTMVKPLAITVPDGAKKGIYELKLSVVNKGSDYSIQKIYVTY